MAAKKQQKEKNLLVQGSILAVAGVITKIIGAVYRVPLVNILGDKGMGYYGVAFQIYSIALTLTSYSLPLAVSKLVSARVAVGQYKNSYKVFRGALTFAILVGGTAALILFLGADVIASELMAMKLSAYALRVLAPCVLIVALLGVFRGYFQGNGSMIPTAFSQVLEQIVNAAVSVGGAYMLLKLGKSAAGKSGKDTVPLAYGAAGGTLGTVAGALSALLFLIFIYMVYKRVLKRQIRRDRSRRRESYKKIYKILLLTIAPVLLSSTVYNLCGVIDNAMFGKIMAAQGHKESEYAALLGVISGKYDTLINVPLAFAHAIAASLIPSIVTAVQSKKRRQVHNKIDLFTRFTMVVAIPSAVGFLVLAKPLLDLIFFTENNAVAAVTLQLGAVSVVFYCLSTITNAVLQGIDDMMTPVKNAAIALVVHAVALFGMMVLFSWGIYAVVLSKIVFAAAVCILNAHSLRERVGYVQEQKKAFIIPIIASAIMGAATLLVHLLFGLFVGEQIATVIALLAAVAVYGVSIIFLGGITQSEMMQMPMGRKLAAVCRRLHLFKS